MVFEHLDKALIEIMDCLGTRDYYKAKEIALKKLAECINDWGYDPKGSKGEYIRQFRHWNAFASRKITGFDF